MTEPTNEPQHCLRIGAVNYLNTKPLVLGLPEALSGLRLTYDLPSRLAKQLADHSLDVALVPVVELASHPEWSVVSDACIACRGPVLSVKIMFRVEPAQVRSLALDEGSRTSAILAQILLHERFGIRPDLTPLPIGCGAESAETDAVLVIGDRAIDNPSHGFIEMWDLGDCWCQSTELPFVFAVWAARPGVTTGPIAVALNAARDNGCRHLEQIAQEQSRAMQLPLEQVREYLRDHLHFNLGPAELRGLALFFQRAAHLGLIANPPRILFDDCPLERS